MRTVEVRAEDVTPGDVVITSRWRVKRINVVQPQSAP